MSKSRISRPSCLARLAALPLIALASCQLPNDPWFVESGFPYPPGAMPAEAPAPMPPTGLEESAPQPVLVPEQALTEEQVLAQQQAYARQQFLAQQEAMRQQAMLAWAIQQGNVPGASPAAQQPQPGFAPIDPRAASGAGGAQQAAMQRDPVLVGHWSRSESFGGGGVPGGAVRETLTVQPNGTFHLGAGQYAGLGGSMQGGDGTSGMWATQNGVVYVRDAYSPWEAYARYHVGNGKLMFTFGDDSKQIWYRN